jgi:polysaccharide export outer membrane protein
MTANLLLSDESVRNLALALLHFLWQGALLGAMAWGALHILAPRRAQVRYAVHCGLLLLLVAFPIATFLALLTDTSQAAAMNTPPPHGGSLLNATEDESTLDTAASTHSQQRLGIDLQAWLDRSQAWLVGGWFIGIAIFGIRLALGAVGIWRIMRTRQPLPPDVAAMVNRLIQSMAFRVRPAVYVTEQVSQAIAIGVFKPMVLLPAAWVLELQPDMLEAVVAHELAHLRRWDLPINLLQRLVETLLFFHPVVWWCSRRMRIERELCCDERATQATGDRAGYVEALAFLAEQQGSTWEPLLAAGIGGSRMVLLERIRNVLGISRRAHGRFYGLSCAFVGAAAASLAWLLVFSATREESEVSAVGRLPSTTAGIGYEEPESKARSTIAPPQKVEPRASWSAYARTAGTVVPSEKNKVTLPIHILEPPDILFIQSLRVVPKRPCRIQPSDILEIELERSSEGGKRSSTHVQAVSSSGRIYLGPGGEKIPVQGLTEDEAAEAIGKLIADSRAIVKVTHSANLQPISGEHLIAPDGTVNLGSYGLVPLAGKTLEEAHAAIEEHLSAVLEQPQVNLSVYAYNSKVYYVVTEGQSLGDTVARFPITGNETVLDALSQVNNLNGLSDKKIWIARPRSGRGSADVVLPVNYQQITHGESTETNYQVLPGDRIFISETSPTKPSKPATDPSWPTKPDAAGVGRPQLLEYIRYF